VVPSSDANAEAWQPPPGFDEYKLIRPLGSGRMGVVYLAHDELLERDVAVKFIPTIDDDALTRFLVEARAAARVQHPNVATLYRVGQLDDRPYLIYELVRGTSLDRVPRPIDPAQVLRIAVDLTRGLAAAHRRGVLHRDIKPGNVILADTGEAKLLDFGVAKLMELAAGEDREPAGNGERPAGALSADDQRALGDLTQGQLLGTPYFMSPEAWKRQASERSDLFSLGILLYELLAGKGPFRDVPLLELPVVVVDRDARPLRAVAPSVPEGLAGVVDRCIKREPGERFASADHLLAALESLRPARASAKVPEGNPYRGLRPFDAEHRSVFFGRERALAQALDRLRVERFVVVTGDSGVGKSSICAAGILPIVSEGGLEDGRSWSVARSIPGRSPVLALAAALAPVVRISEEELERRIADDPASLGRALRKQMKEHDGLLLYVDQLEELVTLATPADAAATSEAIGVLASGLAGVQVLATARSDFLSRLEALPGFHGRVSRALFLLAPLDRDEVREAIVGPAAVKNVTFESDATVDTLVDSTMAAQGAMPLLQFALGELWERRDVAAGVIRDAALDQLGGVSGALSRHADNLVDAMMPSERIAARALLLRLVTVEHTRARRLEDELIASPHARSALDALVRGRLVVAVETAEGTTYEIAHEALVTGWSTLARWLVVEADARAIRHRLETAAAAWRHHDRERDLLWNTRQLAEAEPVIRGGELTPKEREFVDASRRGSRRTRWLRRAAVVGVVVIAAGVWIGAQIKAGMDRDDAIAADVSRADERMARARALETELAGLRQSTFALFDQGKAADGEQRWQAARASAHALVLAYADVGDHLERALLRDTERGDVRRRYAELLYRRALLAESLGQRDEVDELVRRMSLYDDTGRYRAELDAPARFALRTSPPGARVAIRRYDEREGVLVLGEGRDAGVTPHASLELAPGSYVLELRMPGRPPVDYPLLAQRAESRTIDVAIPKSIPEGFVYVPAGRTRIGHAGIEERREFFNAQPAHAIDTGPYLIARHETTFAEWIAYLESRSPDERRMRTPLVGEGRDQAGAVELKQLVDGRWELVFSPGGKRLQARNGEPIRYPGRTSANAEQDWQRFPVIGVSYIDAVAYAAWVAERVPGARPCREVEWERAARGADDRLYPHGETLRPFDANVDITYGRVDSAFGPDEVGSHPASRSPFGADDMAGNVWEWVTTEEGTAAARGGSFYYRASNSAIANRESPPPEYRDVGLGLRLCADVPIE
jgi:serine/threonine protein kinase/formylglycine-generating enzyme required for sulfatase activity